MPSPQQRQRKKTFQLLVPIRIWQLVLLEPELKMKKYGKFYMVAYVQVNQKLCFLFLSQRKFTIDSLQSLPNEKIKIVALIYIHILRSN